MTLQANFVTYLPGVAQRKSVRLISGRPRYRHSPSGPIAHLEMLEIRCGLITIHYKYKKPYGGYGLPSPAIRIHIAGASPA